jgi:predicted alpha-1,6-mannanase (GH76 family)
VVDADSHRDAGPRDKDAGAPVRDASTKPKDARDDHSVHDAGTDVVSSPDSGAGHDASDATLDAPSPDLGAGGDFGGYADSAMAALQAMYDTSTGLYPSTGWWNSANALTVTIDYSIATGSTLYVGDLANTFSLNSSSNFLDGFYDDEGWWALAWIRAYDLTQGAQYLAMAKTIFTDMTGGWDATTCNGGIWWDKTKTYKNAIANELFLEVAIRLHERTPGDGTGDAAGSYLDWATREWSWFEASGLINAENLVNDGLTSACANNGETTWTYNQGVIIGGLVDLAGVTGDASLLARADAIATATMTTLVDPYGVLRESCEPTSCGADGPQFKGVFMRHLAELWAKTNDPVVRAFIANNADWVWNADSNENSQLGLVWSGPVDGDDAARQSSGLDALIAAIPFTIAEPNLALSKPATANGTCATGQAAPMADDGLITTKWCSGATNGGYWLDIDLGSPVSVSRMIVRHAGAGGEDAGYNTRDFTLSVSPDEDGGPAMTVAAVTGNTNDVTIHRFAPTQASRVVMDISSPQTTTANPAARVYDLEVYAR